MVMENNKKYKNLTDWLKDQDDYGIFAPPMESNTAIDFLRHYLLGENWYSPNPCHLKQINTEIVHLILLKYSKEYRKEYYKGDTEGWLTKVLKALRSWMHI